MLITDKEFFTVSDLMDLLGVDRHRIIAYIKRNELRAVDVSIGRKIRPRWRISRKDLESFLARRATTPIPKPKHRRMKHQSSDDEIQFYQE